MLSITDISSQNARLLICMNQTEININSVFVSVWEMIPEKMKVSSLYLLIIGSIQDAELLGKAPDLFKSKSF